jgi:hypothetical protein
VLDFELKDTCVYLGANDTVDRAREIFANDIGKRVFSPLVSESGKAEEKPINIVILPLGFRRRRASMIRHVSVPHRPRATRGGAPA